MLREGKIKLKRNENSNLPIKGYIKFVFNKCFLI